MTDSSPPVTLKMIAQAAGVTHPTVSRALRNDPRNVSAATRARIQEIAQSMGYRPDPAMSALIAHRSRVRPHGEHGKLAILNTWGRAVKQLDDYIREQVHGIDERAAELGYETEVFDVPEELAGQRQLSRVLWNRGIQGIIVGPLPVTRSTLSLDWEKFYAVSVGYSLLSPQLHYVASNHLATIEMIYSELRRLGYRRIGFLHDQGAEIRNRHLYLAAYLKCQAIDGFPRRPLPPLLPGAPRQPALREWLDRHAFDAVICGGTYEHDLLESTLAAMDRRIPRDVGLAVFPLPHGSGSGLAGVLEDWQGLGKGAVNLLHSLILSGKRGLPLQRNSILIEGSWRLGSTVRPLEPASKALPRPSVRPEK